MKQPNPQPRPNLTAVAVVEDLEAAAWLQVTDALRDYAAAVEALERAGSPAISGSTTPGGRSPADSRRPAGQGHFALAAAACARARRRVEDALLILDAVAGAESPPLTYDALPAYFATEDSAAS